MGLTRWLDQSAAANRRYAIQLRRHRSFNPPGFGHRALPAAVAELGG